jgi:hypothetical protein
MIVKVGRFNEKANANVTGEATRTDLSGGPGGPMSAGPLTAAISGDASFNPFSNVWAGGPTAQRPSQPAVTQQPVVPVVGRGAGGGGPTTSGKVAFKSKVVSRGHGEIWCESDGKVGDGWMG